MVEQHVSQGGEQRGSKLTAAVIGLASLALIMGWSIFRPVGAFARGLWSQSNHRGSRRGLLLQLPPRRRGSWKLVGDKLESIGYYTDKGSTPYSSQKDQGGSAVSFYVQKGDWDKPDAVLAIGQVGGKIARCWEMPHQSAPDQYEARNKENLLSVKSSLEPKTRFATSVLPLERKPRPLGQALLTAGCLSDTGATVLLSKGDGTVISLVVNEACGISRSRSQPLRKWYAMQRRRLADFP